MSKAFTKEDDDAGVALPSASSLSLPSGPLRLTATGFERLRATKDETLRVHLARVESLPPQMTPHRAALGVTVRIRTATGEERNHRLVTPEEYALLGDGVSIHSPLGRALLGAEVGDVRHLRAPRGTVDLEVMELFGEGADASSGSSTR